MQFLRDLGPEDGVVFFAMPFSERQLADGRHFDFDQFYREVLAPTVEECRMTPIRADSIYGPAGVLDIVWRGIQRASVVVVDFTGKSPNVALECGWALLLGKRVIVLVQDAADIPTDIAGFHRYIPYSEQWGDVNRLKAELAQQLEAICREPSSERALIPMPAFSTESIPAHVAAIEREFAIVETPDGRRSVLGAADVDYSRMIPDMSRRFRVGDQVEGTFEIDPRGGTKYSLVAGKTNPWPDVARRMPVGTVFETTVQRVVNDLGAFVSLDGELNALLPTYRFPAGIQMAPGTRLEVEITRMEPDGRRAQVACRSVVEAPDAADLGEVEVGTHAFGEVVRCVPERDGRGGFLLLSLPGARRAGLLHVSRMSDELHEDLNTGDVTPGDEIYVEIVEVNRDAGRIILEERDAPEEEFKADAAA